jgi:hypothetical protein
VDCRCQAFRCPVGRAPSKGPLPPELREVVQDDGAPRLALEQLPGPAAARAGRQPGWPPRAVRPRTGSTGEGPRGQVAGAPSVPNLQVPLALTT